MHKLHQHKTRAAGWWCGLSAVAMATGLLTAPGAHALDLSTANTAAQANDAGIRATRAGTDAQRERLLMAQAQLKPNLSVSGSYNSNLLDTTTNTTTQRDRYTSSNVSLSVRQPLYRKGLWLGVDQAKSIIEDAAASQAAEEQNLTVKVSTA